MNPIYSATISVTADPAIMLIQREVGDPISYASINCHPQQAIDMLRHALIHLVAEQAGLATIPTHAAITANGHTPTPPSNPSNPSDPIPPLRAPETRPAAAAAPTRGKPGPKPGTARKRKAEPTYSLHDLGLDEDEA